MRRALLIVLSIFAIIVGLTGCNPLELELGPSTKLTVDATGNIESQVKVMGLNNHLNQVVAIKIHFNRQAGLTANLSPAQNLGEGVEVAPCSDCSGTATKTLEVVVAKGTHTLWVDDSPTAVTLIVRD